MLKYQLLLSALLLASCSGMRIVIVDKANEELGRVDKAIVLNADAQATQTLSGSGSDQGVKAILETVGVTGEAIIHRLQPVVECNGDASGANTCHPCTAKPVQPGVATDKTCTISPQEPNGAIFLITSEEK